MFRYLWIFLFVPVLLLAGVVDFVPVLQHHLAHGINLPRIEIDALDGIGDGAAQLYDLVFFHNLGAFFDLERLQLVPGVLCLVQGGQHFCHRDAFLFGAGARPLAPFSSSSADGLVGGETRPGSIRISGKFRGRKLLIRISSGS